MRRGQRMTLYQTFEEASLVLRPLQDARHHAVADQFPDRRSAWSARCCWRRGLRALGRKLMIASVVLLAICGFSPLGNWLLYPLEQRFPPWDAARGAPDGIVVLGGSIDADLSAAHGVAVVRACGRPHHRRRALARRYPNARIVLHRRKREFAVERCKEADYAAALFESLGIAKSAADDGTALAQHPGKCRILQGDGWRRKSGERWLLVTSAFHMPRSVGLFRKAGFAVEPYPVDWRVGGRGDLLTFSLHGERGARSHRYRRCANGSGLSPIGSPARSTSCFRGRRPTRTVATVRQSG